MQLVTLLLTVTGGCIFGLLGVAAFTVARRAPFPRTRSVGSFAAWCCAALAVGAWQRTGLLADRYGWVDHPLAESLLYEYQFFKSSVIAAMSIAAAFHGVRFVSRMQESEQLISDVFGTGLTRTRQTGMNAEQYTSREREVLSVLATGRITHKEIAGTLHVSPHTAHSHMKNIMRKAGVSNRRELLPLALHIGGHRDFAQGPASPTPDEP